MCRLLGIRSRAVESHAELLVDAENSLVAQSRGDRSGQVHVDGWGIAAHVDGQPIVRKRAVAAADDAEFAAAAHSLRARTLVAHVRHATVSGRRTENAHPFTSGRWTFAHNGTVRGFDTLRRQLDHEIDATLRRSIAGGTDSEWLFHWLLARIARAPRLDAGGLASLVAVALGEIDERTTSVGGERSELNVVLTDGDTLIASRWGRPLFLGTDSSASRLVVASEPIGRLRWTPVRSRAVLAIDRNCRQVAMRPRYAGAPAPCAA